MLLTERQIQPTLCEKAMISYNQQTKVMHLTNGKMSYMIYVNDAGYLEHIYMGAAIGDIDCIRTSAERHDSSYYYDRQEGAEHRYSDLYMNNASPLELSAHAVMDKRHAPLVMRHADGSYETDMRYVSHVITDGVPPIEGMPHARGGDCETVDFLLRDRYGVEVHYLLTIYRDKNILLKSMRIVNNTPHTVHLLRAMSLQLDLPDDRWDWVHFAGRWQKERDLVRAPLRDGVQEIYSNRGRTSHEENAFVYLLRPHTTEDSGEAIGLNLIYSGNFACRIEVNNYRATHITYGIADEDFDWVLSAGGTFATPQAVIAYSTEGVDGMSQAMHAFIRQNLINSRLDGIKKPILFNSWEGCFFDFDTERVLSYIDDGVKIGMEMFVLDDGWFGARNDDTAGLGDWQVNQDKVDLARVMAHCHELGLKVGIWFEPEMVNYDSDLYRKHPEYALLGGGNQTSCIRHQFHLDFANPIVVDEIYRQLTAFFDQYPVDYIKWDYNRIVCEHYSPTLPAARQGEVYHRLTLGYYDLLERLTARYPQLFIEGCASGGGRFDIGTLYYAPQIWASDESDPAQRMEINYTTSLGYPLSTIGAHVNASPVASYRAKAILALFGTYGYEMNPNRLSAAEQADLADIAAIYHRYHREVIEQGTLYHLLDPYQTNYMCMQCVSPDRNTSLVVIINRKKELDRFRYLRLKGLSKDARYHNDYEDATHTGEYYMHVGINYSRDWLEEFTCRLIVLTRVED
jgi:alpha-galactosidase